MEVVLVTFHFETANISTVVYVENLEHEGNIKNKAVATARVHLAQEYGIDVDALGYESVSTREEATV